MNVFQTIKTHFFLSNLFVFLKFIFYIFFVFSSNSIQSSPLPSHTTSVYTTINQSNNLIRNISNLPSVNSVRNFPSLSFKSFFFWPKTSFIVAKRSIDKVSQFSVNVSEKPFLTHFFFDKASTKPLKSLLSKKKINSKFLQKSFKNEISHTSNRNDEEKVMNEIKNSTKNNKKRVPKYFFLSSITSQPHLPSIATSLTTHSKAYLSSFTFKHKHNTSLFVSKSLSLVTKQLHTEALPSSYLVYTTFMNYSINSLLNTNDSYNSNAFNTDGNNKRRTFIHSFPRIPSINKSGDKKTNVIRYINMLSMNDTKLPNVATVRDEIKTNQIGLNGTNSLDDSVTNDCRNKSCINEHDLNLHTKNQKLNAFKLSMKEDLNNKININMKDNMKNPDLEDVLPKFKKQKSIKPNLIDRKINFDKTEKENFLAKSLQINEKTKYGDKDNPATNSINEVYGSKKIITKPPNSLLAFLPRFTLLTFVNKAPFNIDNNTKGNLNVSDGSDFHKGIQRLQFKKKLFSDPGGNVKPWFRTHLNSSEQVKSTDFFSKVKSVSVVTLSPTVTPAHDKPAETELKNEGVHVTKALKFTTIHKKKTFFLNGNKGARHKSILKAMKSYFAANKNQQLEKNSKKSLRKTRNVTNKMFKNSFETDNEISEKKNFVDDEKLTNAKNSLDKMAINYKLDNDVIDENLNKTAKISLENQFFLNHFLQTNQIKNKNAPKVTFENEQNSGRVFHNTQTISGGFNTTVMNKNNQKNRQKGENQNTENIKINVYGLDYNKKVLNKIMNNSQIWTKTYKETTAKYPINEIAHKLDTSNIAIEKTLYHTKRLIDQLNTSDNYEVAYNKTITNPLDNKTTTKDTSFGDKVDYTSDNHNIHATLGHIEDYDNGTYNRNKDENFDYSDSYNDVIGDNNMQSFDGDNINDSDSIYGLEINGAGNNDTFGGRVEEDYGSKNFDDYYSSNNSSVEYYYYEGEKSKRSENDSNFEERRDTQKNTEGSRSNFQYNTLFSRETDGKNNEEYDDMRINGEKIEQKKIEMKEFFDSEPQYAR